MPKRISEQVIGCRIEVRTRLGSGFVEAVYENALCAELRFRKIGFERQPSLKVMYKGEVVGRYIADIVVEGQLLLELKAVRRLLPEHHAQVMNYLRATGLTVALLMNFGNPRLEYRRLVCGYEPALNI